MMRKERKDVKLLEVVVKRIEGIQILHTQRTLALNHKHLPFYNSQ